MKIVLYFGFSLFLVILDQYTKLLIVENFRLGETYAVIDGFFNLTHVRNPGAAFGFGGEFSDVIRYGLFKILPVVACLWLAWLLVKSAKSSSLLSWTYALILGGAIGNLIDRFRLDYVVDFFDFYYGRSHFATFNVADSAISVAAGLLIIDYFINSKKTTDEDRRD